MLNKHMNNTEFLTQLYYSVHALGLVKTQDDLSRLCGRAPAWFSSIKSRNIPMSTSAAITLRLRVTDEMTSTIPRRLKPLAKQVTASLDLFAQARSLKKDWH